MPFTIGGNWIPELDPVKQSQSGKPIKVIKEKRGQSIVTLVLNLKNSEEMKLFCSQLKQQLGCGGSVKKDKIELQGDKVELVKQWLRGKGCKIPN